MTGNLDCNCDQALALQEELNKFKATKWQDMGLPTPAKGEPMILTESNFYKMLAMAHELIDDQVIEISKLTHKVNQLQQKLSRTVKYTSNT